MTGCIVGSLWPLSVLRGSTKWKSNHEQAGMTMSRCHQLLFLPNPKETDSIMLLEGKDHSFLSAFFFFFSFLLPVSIKRRSQSGGPDFGTKTKGSLGNSLSHANLIRETRICQTSSSIKGSRLPKSREERNDGQRGSAVQRCFINYLHRQ